MRREQRHPAMHSSDGGPVRRSDSQQLGDTNHNGVINHGEGLCFDAVAPDNNVTDPELAEFSNRVDVSAVPALGSATPQTSFSTDSCPLCVGNTD